VDLQQGTGQPQPPRPLTEAELTLLAKLDSLIETPREAKRLFNLYRMLRARPVIFRMCHAFSVTTAGPGNSKRWPCCTADARLLGKALYTPADPERGLAGGLVHRSAGTSWERFVADYEPHAAGAEWTNPIAGTLPAAEVRDWFRLHRGLHEVSAALTELTAFQQWVPRIRRFSYVFLPTEAPPRDEVVGRAEPLSGPQKLYDCRSLTAAMLGGRPDRPRKG
jgi:hypothetical protein